MKENMFDSQFEKLFGLQDGWFDGGSKAFSREGLEWLKRSFDEYSEHLPRPYFFPTPEGKVLVEWEMESWRPSLEVDLEAKTCELHSINLDNRQTMTADVQLDETVAWKEVFLILTAFAFDETNILSNGIWEKINLTRESLD